MPEKCQDKGWIDFWMPKIYVVEVSGVSGNCLLKFILDDWGSGRKKWRVFFFCYLMGGFHLLHWYFIQFFLSTLGKWLIILDNILYISHLFAR